MCRILTLTLNLKDMAKETLISLFQNTIRDNWDSPAMTDFHGASFQYRDVARKIAKIHLLYERTGIKPGDKVALCGRNCSQWAIAFIATVTYGAIIVPILHDFKADNIHNLVRHSDARLLFVDASIWENLDPEAVPALEGVLLITDFSLLLSRSERLSQTRLTLNRIFGEKYPERFTPQDVIYVQRPDDEVAAINYTSGSTGFSKGVMVTYRNLWSNIRFCLDKLIYVQAGDPAVCMLPLAHMYGLTIEMLFTFCRGCHIYFLTRTPSPRIIMDAFAAIRPKIIITVPLIIEKIIKTKVFPLLDKPLMKLMLHVPFVDERLLGKIKTRLNETFGGNLQELIIGGAGLNKDVETFLRRIRFPFTVGYGMTECAPLICYSDWSIQREGSCGQVVDRMEARIDSPDPMDIPGVLWVRGENVMKGYYKNPEATDATFRDGWMNTGDICQTDDDGFIYIRGRDKNMILGPSGQNIYPEEIEQKINNLPYVNESLVVDEYGKLVALVYPDYENACTAGISESELEPMVEQNIRQLNSELPGYSQIARVRIYHEEFEKTPKRSIKRYLYQH